MRALPTLAHRTTQEKRWIVGGAAAALVIAAIGWLAFISPQRAETEDVRSQTDNVRLENVGLQTRISSLRAESKKMDDVQGKLKAAQQALPSTSGVSDFLRSLQSLGGRTHTDIVTLTVGTPVDVSDVASGGGPAGSAPSTDPSASSAPASTAPAPAAPGTGVYALTITAQVNGTTDQLAAFLDKLQTVQPRAVLVTQVTEGASDATAGSGTSLQLSMQAFVAPSSAVENSQLSHAAGG